MPGVLPNERLLPTPFKNVSTNLHVSKCYSKLPSSVRPQTLTTRASRPRIFACPTHLPPRLDGAPPLLKTNREEVATFSSKRWHQKDQPKRRAQQSTNKQHPLQNWGVPRLRSVHVEWVCPDNRPT